MICLNWKKPLTRAYWESVGGEISFDFPMVRGSMTAGRRVADALIIEGRRTQMVNASDMLIDGEDVKVVQTARTRLSMNLIGQAIVSKKIIEIIAGPKSCAVVAVCTRSDSVLDPIAAAMGVEVVVMSSLLQTGERVVSF